MTKPVLKSWKKADKACTAFLKKLGVPASKARCHAVRINGRKRKGWRVTAIRLSDGMTMTKFLPD